MREQPASGVVERDACFVARAFDAENDHGEGVGKARKAFSSQGIAGIIAPFSLR
jgi:hypothetical protein